MNETIHFIIAQSKFTNFARFVFLERFGFMEFDEGPRAINNPPSVYRIS